MDKILCRVILLAGLVPGGAIGAQNAGLSLRHAIERQTDLSRGTYFTIVAARSTLTEADLVLGLASPYPLVQSASAHKLAELPSLQPATVRTLADVAAADERGEVTPRVAAALLQIGLHQPELVAPLVADVRPIRLHAAPEAFSLPARKATGVAVSDLALSALREAGYTDVTRLLALQAHAPPSTADQDYLEAGSSHYYALAIATLLRDRRVDFATFQSIATANDKNVRRTAYAIAANVEGHTADVVATLVGLIASDEEQYYDDGPAEALMSVGPAGGAAVKALLSSSFEVTRRRAAGAYFGRHGCDGGGADALFSLAPDALNSAVIAMTNSMQGEFYACLVPLATSDRFEREDKLHLIERLRRVYFKDDVLPDSVRSVWNRILAAPDDPLWLALAISVGSDGGVSIPIEEVRRRLRSSRSGQTTGEIDRSDEPLACPLSRLLSGHPDVSDEDAALLLDRLAAATNPWERNCLHDSVAMLHKNNPRFPAPPFPPASAMEDVDKIEALLDLLEATGAAALPVRERMASVLKILKNPSGGDGEQSEYVIVRRAQRATELLLSYPGGEQKVLATLVRSRDPFVRDGIFSAVARADSPPTRRAAFIKVAQRAVNEPSEGVRTSAVYALAALQPKSEFLALAKEFAGASASAGVRNMTFVSFENWGYFEKEAIQANLTALMAVAESYEANEPHRALELVTKLGVSAPTAWRRERIRRALALGVKTEDRWNHSLPEAIRVHWDVASELMAESIDAGLSFGDINYVLRDVSEEDPLVFDALLRRYQQDPSVAEIAWLLVQFQPGQEVVPEVRARLTDARPEVARIAASVMLPTFARAQQLDSGDVGAAKDYAVAAFVERRLDTTLAEIRPWVGWRLTSGELHRLPPFPWPPPPWSFKEVFSASMLGDATTLGQAYDRVVTALRKASPDFDYGLFGVPDGIVVLARMERIKRDGTPLEGSKRWEAGFVRPATLDEYFEELLFSPPGHFRAIALSLAATEPIDSDEDAVLPKVSGGSKRLPDHLRNLPLQGLTTTALIYTFERSNTGKFSRGYSGSPAGLTHLRKAGLLDALSANP